LNAYVALGGFDLISRRALRKSWYGLGARVNRLVNFLFTILMILLGYWIFQSTALVGYPAWLLTLGVVTFLFYGFDKTQSKRKGWRVSEKTLHTLALAGGFVGGWVGMFWFRHKTQKGIFYLILLLSTLLHFYLISNGYFVN